MPVLNLPSSIGNELQMEGLKFCKEFILNSPVPDAIVELTRYKCKKGCKTNHLLANVQIHVQVIIMTIARTQTITDYMKVT